jgi:hypothetical protein
MPAALERNVPGYVVFPMTTGGNLFLVAVAGIFIFREKVGPYGIAGILTGFSHWSCWVSVDLSIVIDISPAALG